MSLEIKGRVTQILPVQSGTSKAGKEWSKQEFIIETDDQFPKNVCFTLFGDKISLLEGVSVSDEVDVSFNVESREYNGRWFHNINAWKITQAANSAQDAVPGFSVDDIPEPPATTGNDAPPADDLPF